MKAFIQEIGEKGGPRIASSREQAQAAQDIAQRLLW
jgi:hypothetical protein